MKRAITRLLFHSYPAVQYLTYGIVDGAIQERVCLLISGKRIDVSDSHYVLCQKPFIIGVWVSNKALIASEQVELEITDRGMNPLVNIKLSIQQTWDLSQGCLVLCKVERTVFSFISRFHQQALVFFFYLKRTNKVSPYELNSFCAAYTFPRKVVLVCSGPDNYNLFPMDLQGFVWQCNMYVLGLRNTNVTLGHILKSGKVVVCETRASEKEILYKLGAHHSNRPPRMEALSFSFKASPKFKIPVPDMVQGFREIEIKDHVNMGTHTILIGNVVNTVQVSGQVSSLHHLHITSAMKRDIFYPIV